MERIKALGIEERARERGSERMTPESKVQLFQLFCASGSKNRLHIEKRTRRQWAGGNAGREGAAECGCVWAAVHLN